MAVLDVSFLDDGWAMRTVGSLVGGWQKWQNGYGFFGLSKIDFRQGLRFQISLQVKARPNHLAHRVSTLPPNLYERHGENSLYYEVRETKITVFVNLLEHLTVDRARRIAQVNWRPNEPINTGNAVRLFVTFLATLRRERNTPATTWERDLIPAFSSQFESNRRKH